ncbi:uncharacterized protein LOC142591583 [Dermacentor variabilis]|uniref:uncharacterized protein LOC142591583 n=1 Tax=Dermacentor variabilis TaxID=34621 RepID=UPI003F5C19B2
MDNSSSQTAQQVPMQLRESGDLSKKNGDSVTWTEREFVFTLKNYEVHIPSSGSVAQSPLYSTYKLVFGRGDCLILGLEFDLTGGKTPCIVFASKKDQTRLTDECTLIMEEYCYQLEPAPSKHLLPCDD